MKPLYWDSVDENGQPYRYDSPNVTWDGILEPGDPGYVPPEAAQTKPKTKTKAMQHTDYYPTNRPAQIIWLENFRNKLANHAATVGITPTQCAALIADARWLIYLYVSWLPAQREWSKSCTEAIKLAESSSNDKLFVLPVFVPPAPPAADPAPGGLPAVIPVKEGALDRIFGGIQLMKDSPGFTPEIGADIGAIGSQATGPDWATLAPTIKVTILNGQIFVTWGWGGYSDYLDACELQVDRGNGWVPLVVDTTPNYIDTTAFPAALTQWKYRAIYNVDGQRKGNWSAIETIAVGG